MPQNISIGVIGGSGVYNLEGVRVIEEKKLETPYGNPSDAYKICELEGTRFVFLSRHSQGHTITPSELPTRANMYGFKMLGVTQLISVSAVGSLREEIEPAHLVFPNQIIDRTKGRESTFFGNGIVAHIPFAEPFCQSLTSMLKMSAARFSIPHHSEKTYVCMEGPAFSTKAESNFHRQIGGDIIGMTAIPEAKLAREAEICYAMIALSTDYDCWKEGEEAVTVEMVLETIKKNVAHAQEILRDVIPQLRIEDCSCRHSLDTAIMTPQGMWPKKTRENLAPIISRFF